MLRIFGKRIGPGNGLLLAVDIVSPGPVDYSCLFFPRIQRSL